MAWNGQYAQVQVAQVRNRGAGGIGEGLWRLWREGEAGGEARRAARAGGIAWFVSSQKMGSSSAGHLHAHARQGGKREARGGGSGYRDPPPPFRNGRELAGSHHGPWLPAARDKLTSGQARARARGARGLGQAHLPQQPRSEARAGSTGWLTAWPVAGRDLMPEQCRSRRADIARRALQPKGHERPPDTRQIAVNAMGQRHAVQGAGPRPAPACRVLTGGATWRSPPRAVPRACPRPRCKCNALQPRPPRAHDGARRAAAALQRADTLFFFLFYFYFWPAMSRL